MAESNEDNNCASARRRVTIERRDETIDRPPLAPAPAPPPPPPPEPSSEVPPAPRAWAPASTAKIHPGVQTINESELGQCTANFIFTDRHQNVYIGQAAHCTMKAGMTEESDGCTTKSLPLGWLVNVDGASEPGTLAYSSWLTMQTIRDADPAPCDWNDFALIRLAPDDAAKVNPSVPGWGGPVGLASLQDQGDDVYGFGNSSLRAGVRQLSPKRGVVIERTASGWSTIVYTLPQGIPGDSGSPDLDEDGNAAGVFVAWNMYTGWSYISDLPRMLDYAQKYSGLEDLVLAHGTEPFNPDFVHAIIGP